MLPLAAVSVPPQAAATTRKNHFHSFIEHLSTVKFIMIISEITIVIKSSFSWSWPTCSSSLTNINEAQWRHICCSPVKPIQKSFFLTFPQAENTGLKSFFCKRSNPRYIFGFALKIGTGTLKKLIVNFWKCNPSPPCHPQRHRAVNSLVLLNKLNHYFWVSIDVKTYFSILKWNKIARQSPFIIHQTGIWNVLPHLLEQAPRCLFNFSRHNCGAHSRAALI